MSEAAEIQGYAVALGKFTRTQLLQICVTTDIQVPDSADRKQIIMLILKSAGYKLPSASNKTPPAGASTPPRREITTEDLDHLLYRYLNDELMLLKAVTAGIETEIALRDVTVEKTPEGYPVKVSYSSLKDRMDKAMRELRYYQSKSNLRGIANLYRILCPDSKLDI